MTVCGSVVTHGHGRGHREASTWPRGMSLCGPGLARALRILNLFFVFLLAKFIASWQAGGLFKGEKRPSEA